MSLLSSSYSQKKLRDNCYHYASPKPIRIVCLQIQVPYIIVIGMKGRKSKHLNFFVRTLSKVLNSMSMHLHNSRYYAGSVRCVVWIPVKLKSFLSLTSCKQTGKLKSSAGINQQYTVLIRLQADLGYKPRPQTSHGKN